MSGHTDTTGGQCGGLQSIHIGGRRARSAPHRHYQPHGDKNRPRQRRCSDSGVSSHPKICFLILHRASAHVPMPHHPPLARRWAALSLHYTDHSISLVPFLASLCFVLARPSPRLFSISQHCKRQPYIYMVSALEWRIGIFYHPRTLRHTRNQSKAYINSILSRGGAAR